MLELEGIGTFNVRRPNCYGVRLVLMAIDFGHIVDKLEGWEVVAEAQGDEAAGKAALAWLGQRLSVFGPIMADLGPALVCALCVPLEDINECNSKKGEHRVGFDDETQCLDLADVRSKIPWDFALEVLQEAQSTGVLGKFVENIKNVLGLTLKAKANQVSGTE